MTAQGFFITASAKNVLMVPAAAVKPLSAMRGNFKPGSFPGGGNGFPAGGFRPGGQSGGAGGFTPPKGFTPPQGASAGGPPGAPGGFALPQGGAPGAAGGFPANGSAARGGGGRSGFAATHGIVEVMAANGKIERRMVEIGVTDRINTEIKSGLKEGDKVVIGEAQPKVKPPSGGNSRGGRPMMFGP